MIKIAPSILSADFVNLERDIRHVAAAGAEVYITGDVDYHIGIDAFARGIRVIDAGHYGTEHCFIDDVAAFLEKKCPECSIVRAKQRPPYIML